jgi:hypothetical protein
VDHRDRLVRQARARVLARDLRVVPLRDLLEIDVGDRLAVELETRLDPGDVVGDGDPAEDGRDVDRIAALLRRRGDLVVAQRRVAAREVGGALLPRRNAGARADGLEVEGDALALQVRAPLGVDRCGERRAGAADRAAGLRRAG